MDLEDVASEEELEIGTSEKPEELGVDAMESLKFLKESDASGNIVDSIGLTKALLRSISCGVIRGVDVFGGLQVFNFGLRCLGERAVAVNVECRLFLLFNMRSPPSPPLTTSGTAGASEFSFPLGSARMTSSSLSS